MPKHKPYDVMFENVWDAVVTMRAIVNVVIDDAERFDEGSKEAGRRVRKRMNEIKRLAQDIRMLVSAKNDPDWPLIIRKMRAKMDALDVEGGI